MSRPLLILILLIVIVIGGAIALASRNHEVPQTRVEKDVLNDAAAK
ncbi:hypothetical protein [Sphingomonas quercus]|uniref:Uncharacterized protein n=1 Tax=Sphingomonas quercus TaxID=2842451 RepID=A0ABS6BDH3_9SPHN|nr:hypothetical protein [Sphingomonas quercus]MBU3076368.1 hypothetical protein [Sphingomonas quercus]